MRQARADTLTLALTLNRWQQLHFNLNLLGSNTVDDRAGVAAVGNTAMRHGRGEDNPGARDHLDCARRHEVRRCRLPPHHMREFHCTWPVRVHTK